MIHVTLPQLSWFTFALTLIFFGSLNATHIN